MTPNIIHTMKQTVKASVLTASTRQAWRETAGDAEVETMGRRVLWNLPYCPASMRATPYTDWCITPRQKNDGPSRAIVLKNYQPNDSART